MVIRYSSIDNNKFPHSFALMIIDFIKHCLNMTYEQIFEFRIQGYKQGVKTVQVN